MKTITCDICGETTPSVYHHGSTVEITEHNHRRFDMTFIEIVNSQVDLCFGCSSKMVLFVQTELSKRKRKGE